MGARGAASGERWTLGWTIGERAIFIDTRSRTPDYQTLGTGGIFLSPLASRSLSLSVRNVTSEMEKY
jgi:hypothetical protein